MTKFNDETPRVCEYCRYACSIAGTDEMLCEKRGVVAKEYVCRKFVYDPLKRIPRRLPELIVPEDII